MENIKQTFNPEKEVHDAYEKFVRYGHAIINFNEKINTFLILSVIATFLFIILVGFDLISFISLKNVLWFLIYPAVIFFFLIEGEKLKESKPTAEDLVQLKLIKEEDAKKMKENIELHKGIISLLIQDNQITQEQIDNLRHFWFGKFNLIFELNDGKTIEVSLFTITRLIANKIEK